MSTLKIFEDPLDASQIKEQHTDNVIGSFLKIKQQYPQARIYAGNPYPKNDVTPHNQATALKLLNTPQQSYYVVCHAGDPWTIGAYVVMALMAIYAAYTIANMPKNNTTQGSSNNELSERTNKQRIGSRVADIYGTVKSIPDLLAQPYSYYNSDGVEIEECLMCIGRGHYKIHNILDGDTDAANIAGTSVSVYEPGTSIVETAQYQVGKKFDYLPRYVRKSASINGQTLELPNTSKIETSDIYFEAPNIIRATNSDINFKSYFDEGDKIALSGAEFGIADSTVFGQLSAHADMSLVLRSSQNVDAIATFTAIQLSGVVIAINDVNYDISGNYQVTQVLTTSTNGTYQYTFKLSAPKSVNYNWNYIIQDSSETNASIALKDSTQKLNLDGAYTVSSVNSTTTDVLNSGIALANPSEINSDWDKFTSTKGQSALVRFDAVESKYIGWFDFIMADAEQVIFNFFFPNGLFYQDSKGGVWDEWMTVNIDIQSLDSNGLPVGVMTTQQHEISSSNKSQFGHTFFIDLKTPGSFRFRLSRTTSTQNGKSQDTCKIKDVYASAKLDKSQYQGVTVIRSETIATDGALSVKERKLNCLVTRKLYTYQSGQRSDTQVATNNFADIVCALTTDDLIGRRDISTLDLKSLYATAAEINQYFGTNIEFNYTFDNPKTSYEETLATVASAVFCDARRESNVVYFAFEKPQAVPTLLFNHRNKVPESEKRTSNFGVNKDYDGIKLTWKNPDDSWSDSEINLPDDTIVNPQKIDATGVSNYKQAYLLAHRAYNKLLHQRRAIEFQTYHEADLITRNDLILVANDTVPMVLSSGAVMDQDGLYVELSQSVTLEANKNYVIHLQLPNKTVDIINVSATDDDHIVLLTRAPTSALVLEYEGNLSCSQYVITEDSNTKRDLFLVTEKSSDGTITAVNYNAAYYANDQDFITT